MLVFLQIIKMKKANMLLITLTLCFSCSSKQINIEKPESLYPTHYTLRLGEKIKNPSPLPTYTPILIDWHYKNGAIKTVLGFKGWDTNNDNYLDMLEIVGKDGLLEGVVYDFNSDGNVDYFSMPKLKNLIEQ